MQSLHTIPYGQYLEPTFTQQLPFGTKAYSKLFSRFFSTLYGRSHFWLGPNDIVPILFGNDIIKVNHHVDVSWPYYKLCMLHIPQTICDQPSFVDGCHHDESFCLFIWIWPFVKFIEFVKINYDLNFWFIKLNIESN